MRASMATHAGADAGEKNKAVLTREDQVAALRKNEAFDVLVVGGGATGCATALDAASRGLSVALVERNDFSGETSSRSTKLIWAGVRYLGTAVASLLSRETLQNPVQSVKNFVGEIKMVMGAQRERRYFLETQPHLTNWIAIAVPIDRWISWPPPMGHPLFAAAGMLLPAVFKFYDSLCGFTCPPSYIMSTRRARERFPQLDSARMKYTQVFYEGQHNDARTCVAMAMTAAEQGATVANHVNVVEMLKEDPQDAQRVSGVRAMDNITGETFDIRAKKVVLAGGPFTDELRKLEDPDGAPAVRGAAGTHLVLPGYLSSPEMGLLDINTSDGRFLFFLPWQGSTVVGTTDRKGTPSSTPAPPEEEIEWILNEVKKYLSPHLRVRRSDVLSAWRGWRPLAVDPHAPPGAPASRDHTISVNPESKVIFLVGGKWTTSREMAEDVVDRVLKEAPELAKRAGPCKTTMIPFIGGEGYEENLFVQLIQTYSISEDVARHLARTYGVRAWDVCKLVRPTSKGWPRFGVPIVENYPYLEAEIEYAVRNEYARTVRDMLSIRTRLAYLNSDAAKFAAPKVADIMADLLDWTSEEKQEQLDDARSFLSEFGGSHPAQTEPRRPLQDLPALFKSLDHDGSGFVDQIEMQNAAKVLGFSPATPEELLELFRKIPGAETGRIYEKDFVEFWNANLEKEQILQALDKELKLSLSKLNEQGESSSSSGVMFG
ncbi:Glycerol-3-phosphate dehydrogenase, mitochondrial [Hondaea fermentalgiana]|uniref:glycerol-3-phosphate dehydrogenase n=1 Tax=Hondaea fermentalgiana TaxID=2315210 RepID=A0A2R5GDA5_9STRA|nr:Glycerol-3-phosphate dehydrogenase, mitochondrial [Hondaea fermentalgiana]|eukprot:GBG28289.1 Glycerol-3-phosphate dehydrogenase, mitochondrial [Hondaea fermentalgiana]